MLQNSGKLQEMNKISLQLFLKTKLRVLKMKGILKKRLLTLLWKQEKVNGLMLNLLVLYYLAFPFKGEVFPQAMYVAPPVQGIWPTRPQTNLPMPTRMKSLK